MKNIYCITCNTKMVTLKISDIFDKILVFSINCNICRSNDEKISKGKESIEILNILGLIDNMEKYQTNVNYFKDKKNR